MYAAVAVIFYLEAAVGAVQATRPSQAYPASGSARRTVLSCTATIPEHTKLDPIVRDSSAGVEEFDHFRDFAYPANKARWKKNTKQVSAYSKQLQYILRNSNFSLYHEYNGGHDRN